MDEPELNPYAPPAAPIGEAPPLAAEELAAVEAIRHKFLAQEASIKSIGLLHYLGAILCVLPIVIRLVHAASIPIGRGYLLGFFGFYLTGAASQIWLGYGLASLKTWARWIETVVVGLLLVVLLGASIFGMIDAWKRQEEAGGLASVMGALFASVVIVLIPCSVLHLLLSKKGTFVFSPEYRTVIERTPHLKARPGCLTWLLLALIGGFLLLVGALAWFGARR